MQVFRDILVTPTQSLLGESGPAGARGRPGIFRGGPVWPTFALRWRARHCRGLIPWPCDSRPVPTGEPARTAEAGIWCGPVAPHFGHMVADFGARIAQAAHRIDDLPLVFSVGPDREAAPPAFFHEMLRHLGVPEHRVLLVREPTRFDTLHVGPQAERLRGPPPSSAHLDLMDAINARRGPVPQDIGCLFVSRARFPDGRLAAEAYLERAFAQGGAVILQPETLDLAAQLDHYRRARRIVFSEGSALHALQLLGRIEAEVVVLVRRRGTRLARDLLRKRVRRLEYWDLATSLIYGLAHDGTARPNRGLAVLDEAALIARLRGIGIDLAPLWDGAMYRDWRDADVRNWITYIRDWNLNPRARRTVERCLEKARLGIDLDAIWPACCDCRPRSGPA